MANINKLDGSLFQLQDIQYKVQIDFHIGPPF